MDALVSSTDVERLLFASDTRGLCLLGHWCVENNLPGEARAILERLNVQNDPRGIWFCGVRIWRGRQARRIRPSAWKQHF